MTTVEKIKAIEEEMAKTQKNKAKQHPTLPILVACHTDSGTGDILSSSPTEGTHAFSVPATLTARQNSQSLNGSC